MATEARRPVDYNLEYLKTPPGLLRAAEGALAIVALISGVIGSTCADDGRFSFFFFVVITTFLQALLLTIVFVLRVNTIIATFINLPLTLLFNDAVVLAFYFMASILMMLSIGRCYEMVTARVFTSLFTIANFFTLVGLVYIDYTWWKDLDSKEQTQDTGGTTVTAASPTVLTLS